MSTKPHITTLPQASLRRRYFFKLGSNAVNLAVNIGTQAIIPRGLGPQAYGDFNYLTSFFNQVVTFLDMGSSMGFDTKLARRPYERGLVRFFGGVTAGVCITVLTFVFVALSTSQWQNIWLGQLPRFIWLAAVWGLLSWIVKVLTGMADAYGVTVPVELARMMQRIMGLGLVVALYFSHHFNLTALFIAYYVVLIFLIGTFAAIIARSGHSVLGERITWLQTKAYSGEFYGYTHPLLVFALVGMTAGILDRWLLQRFAGSAQQGYYGLAYQVGAACFVFTSAMTPLFIREFSIAFGREDLAAMQTLFSRFIPMFYALAAYFCCFVAVESRAVVNLFGGKDFTRAAGTLAVMAFYPMHQTYGQLCSSVFYATGKTRLFRNITVPLLLLGLPASFFLLAPARLLGAGAGATGLAIKMVAIQVVGVNLQLYFNTRYLVLSFRSFVGHQVLCAGSLFLIASGAGRAVETLGFLRTHELAGFVAAGILYSAAVGALFVAVPWLVGLRRADLSRWFAAFLNSARLSF